MLREVCEFFIITDNMPKKARKKKNGPANIFRCSWCNQGFTRLWNKRRHEEEIHSGTSVCLFSCHMCSKRFKNKQRLDSHLQRKHPPRKRFEERQSALNRAITIMTRVLNIFIGLNCLNNPEYFSSIFETIQDHLSIHQFFKVSLICWAVFKPVMVYLSNEEEEELQLERTFPLRSGSKSITYETNISTTIHEMIDEVKSRVDGINIEGMKKFFVIV